MNIVKSKIADSGHHKKRFTKTRKETLDIITNSESPISAPAILQLLSTRQHAINKTTLYRELSSLLSEKLVNEVKIKPYIAHYESAQLAHHHHLVCSDCGSVEEVVCAELEDPIGSFANRILQKGFAIKNHNLEFYGLCQNCS